MLLSLVVQLVKLRISNSDSNQFLGGQGPASMLGYLAFSGVFLTALRKPISRFTVAEQQLEGEFRYVNSRLLTNSEEIAFYGGNKKEEKVIDTAFQRLVNMLRKSMQFRFGMNVVDNIIAKCTQPIFSKLYNREIS